MVNIILDGKKLQVQDESTILQAASALCATGRSSPARTLWSAPTAARRITALVTSSKGAAFLRPSTGRTLNGSPRSPKRCRKPPAAAAAP